MDVGCGAGEYILFASDFAQTAYGLDISKRYLLRSKLDKIGGLVLGDSRALPSENAA